MDNEKPFQKTSAMKKNNSDLTLKNLSELDAVSFLMKLFILY